MFGFEGKNWISHNIHNISTCKSILTLNITENCSTLLSRHERASIVEVVKATFPVNYSEMTSIMFSICMFMGLEYSSRIQTCF